MVRLTSLEAVEPLLAEPPSEEAESQILALIDQASVLVEAYCGREFAEPVPEKVSIVVAGIVARSMNSSTSSGAVPVGATGMMNVAGSFTRQFQFSPGSTDGGVWLSKMDKQMLRRFKGGAFTVRTW